MTVRSLAAPLLATPVLAGLVLLASSLSSGAQQGVPADVIAALRMPEVIGVMQQEGIAYGADLEEELFPGAGGDRWAGSVALIYDAADMQARFDADFAAALGSDPAVLGPVLEFFRTDPGQRIVGLEIEARRALLDKAVEDAAGVTVADLRAGNDPRIDLIERFAETNDLIDQNVTGAMNANIAFYRGLMEGGAFGGMEMTEADILADVSAQEPEIRSDAEDWLYPFLMLAYEPLSDAEIEAYIAFSDSPAGQSLNAALFTAFEGLFGGISHDLGRAAAEILSGQDI